jgi:pimeloyl-ACP methyl ester carboxylesterase
MGNSILKDTKLTTIDGKSYEYVDVRGNNQLNIVFFNGFRMHVDSWENIIQNVLDMGRVVGYNRLGVGKSSKALTAQTASVVIEDFRSFANAIDLQPPYLIVAHSLGGLYANYYARKYPNEIAAIVFVESPYPDEIVEQKQMKAPAALTGINEGLKYFEKKIDKFKYSEDEVVLYSIDQIKSIENFPSVPTTIITGTQKLPFVPKNSFDVHLKYQKTLVELSPQSIHVLAENSGHFPQITEAELVINEIRAMVNRLR